MRLRHRNPIADALKEQIAAAICAQLGDCPLEQAMHALHLDAADVSRLRRSRLRQFSITRLLRLVVRLGYDVEVRCTPRPRQQVVRRGPASTVTMSVHSAHR